MKKWKSALLLFNLNFFTFSLCREELLYDVFLTIIMRLPDLSLLMLTFRLQAESAVILPPFLGSTLRGAFGKALKNVVCFVPRGDCENCWFREACDYQYIFESPNFADVPREAMHPKLRGQKNVPAPFVLIPPRLNRKQTAPPTNLPGIKNLNDDYLPQSFSPGDFIEFSIVLIGRAAHQWSRVLVAARLLAENGLGASNIRFHLAEVFAHDSRGIPLRVFSRENPRVSTYGVAAVKLHAVTDSRVRMIEENLEKRGEDILGIEFLSPISSRVLLEGKPDTNLNFADLLKKITERLEFLAVLHGEPPEKIDYRPFLTETKKVRTIENSLTRYRFEQHSNRQERTIPRDVFLGQILYQGEKLNDFLPCLAAGEILNVGSNTSAGLGRFTVNL